MTNAQTRVPYVNVARQLKCIRSQRTPHDCKNHIYVEIFLFSNYKSSISRKSYFRNYYFTINYAFPFDTLNILYLVIIDKIVVIPGRENIRKLRHIFTGSCEIHATVARMGINSSLAHQCLLFFPLSASPDKDNLGLGLFTLSVMAQTSA